MPRRQYISLESQCMKNLPFVKTYVEECISKFRDKSLEVRQEAVGALLSIGEPAVLPLIECLRDKNESVHYRAVYILGIIGDYRAVSRLIELCKSRDRYFHSIVFEALIGIGDVQGIARFSDLYPEAVYLRSMTSDAINRLGGIEFLPIRILSRVDLSALERLQILASFQMLLRYEIDSRAVGKHNSNPLNSIPDFCCRVIRQKDSDETIKESAREVLSAALENTDYTTLLRASEKDPEIDRRILLRSAAGTSDQIPSSELLRPTYDLPTFRESNSIRKWICRLFKGNILT